MKNKKDAVSNYDALPSKDPMVKHPNHYAGKYECIDIMHYLMERKKDVLGTGLYDFGTAFKYLWRLGEKSPDSVDIESEKQKVLQDIDKAITYLLWVQDCVAGRELRK